MANTIGFGQAAVNNTIGFGQGALTGGTPFSNTKSIELDGMDAYVDMGDVLDFDRLDSFSISCWFKRNTPYTTEFVIDKSESSGNYTGYSILIPSTDDKIYFTLRHTLSNFIQVKSNTAITDTDWHNLVITYSGSSLISGVNIYIDNVNDTGTGTGTLGGNTTTAQPFQIGARNGANNFLGIIDEVSVYNSQLSASDVSTIYGTGVPNDISSISGLVSWWRFEGTGTTAIDSGTGGNDGILDNTVVRSTDVPT